MIRSLIAAAALAFAFIAPAQASYDVTSGATVALTGDNFGATPYWWADGALAAPGSLVDGITLSDHNTWNQGTVFWSGNGAESNLVTVTLATASWVDRINAQVDDNDQYLVRYRDSAGVWHDFGTLAPEVSWGVADAQIYRSTPVLATAFEITARGDNAYAMSEFRVFGSPVPEVSSGWLLLIGLVVFGAWRTVRQERR